MITDDRLEDLRTLLAKRKSKPDTKHRLTTQALDRLQAAEEAVRYLVEAHYLGLDPMTFMFQAEQRLREAGKIR